MKADYINEIRSRKHDMMPHLRQLSSARKNLWYYLSHKDQFTDEQPEEKPSVPVKVSISQKKRVPARSAFAKFAFGGDWDE